MAESDPIGQRRVPRFRVSGKALWSLNRIEGQCQIRDLSLFGASIEGDEPPLEIGNQLTVTLIVDGESIPNVRVEVLHTGNGLGLKFAEPDEALVRRVAEITADLTPTWSLFAK